MSNITKITYTINADDMGDATHEDAQLWATHVERRLGEQFPGAELDVRAIKNQSAVTVVDADDASPVHEFLGMLWDLELGMVFAG